MSLSVQFLTLFMMFASGFILGVLYDVYRVSAGSIQLQRWTVSIFDIFYWLAATLIVFKMLYESNQGEVRLFVFIGLLLGAWFYFHYISTYTVTIVKRLLKLIRRISAWIYRGLELLVFRPVFFLYKIIRILFGMAAAMTMFVFKIMVQWLYPLTLLVNMIRKLVRKRL